jgi:hypothetical protein
VAGSNKGGGGALFNRWICAASVMAKRRRLLVNNIDRFIIDGVFWCMIVLIQQFRNSFFLSMGTFVWLSVVSTKLLKDRIGDSSCFVVVVILEVKGWRSWLFIVLDFCPTRPPKSTNEIQDLFVHSHFSSNRW